MKNALYEIKLMPHRSLGPNGFRRLMLALFVITGLASLRFIAVGAWPVVIFVAVDIAAIWAAFALSYRNGRAYEKISLTKTDLIVAKVGPSGQQETTRLEPYWAQPRLETLDEDNNQLVLRSRENRVTLGTFLPPLERADVRDELALQLARWRAGSLNAAE